MAQTLTTLRLEAQQRANQENKTLVAITEWNRYINEAISELYDLILAINPHYYVLSFPFTLSSVNTLDLATVSSTSTFGVSGFYKLRGVDYLPNANGIPVAVRPFNFAERNRQGVRAYALEGTLLRIHPSSNFAGNYAVWYTPRPAQLPANNFTVRLATTAALPACTPSGSSVGKLLTANANGALSVDGTAVVGADRVLVNAQINPIDNGIYVVNAPGTGGTPFVLMRAPDYDQDSEINTGDITLATAGTRNTGQAFLNTSLPNSFSTDVAAMTWQFMTTFLDPILEDWSEYIVVRAALSASVKEQDAENVANLQGQLQALTDRINKGASQRDGEPQQAADLTSPDYSYIYDGLVR